MKICVVSHSFFPTIGGAELVVHHLSKHMTIMGEEVIVFTHHKNFCSSFQFNYNVKYYPRVPKEILQGFIFSLFLILIQKRNHFDIIHVHVAKMGYYAAKIKKILKTPIVITTHGRDLQKFPEIGYGFRLDPRWNKRIEYALKNADLVTAIGSSTRQEYLKIGVQKNRIADIPNGVDLKRFQASSQNIRKILNLPADMKIVLVVGRYDIKKGFEYLIRAIPEVIKKQSNVKFLFIGKDLNILRPLIQKLLINPYIIVLEQQTFNQKESSIINLDKIPNDILLSAYKSSDVFVSPSLIEGFALVIIEAMASGLPIVATNVSGNEDAIINGKNGILVPSRNPKELAAKIIEILQNNEMQKHLAKNAIEMSSNYDWKIITNKYLAQYKRLMTLYDKKH
jgi:glycosyltransferase involved in cell wall biosynthesis